MLERAQREDRLSGAEDLTVNYLRLRRVEGILRRWSYEGESALPSDAAAFERVSVRCGYVSPEAFSRAMAGCRESIRRIYESFFT